MKLKTSLNDTHKTHKQTATVLLLGNIVQNTFSVILQ